MARRLGVPQDEWAHPDALHEWWYVNSHLVDGGGRSFGAVAAFFHDYMLFGLADKGERRMVRAEVVRGQRLDSWDGGVRYGDSSFARAGGRGGYSLECASEGVSLRLEVEPEKGPLLVNRVGKVREGLLGDSWYYSLTMLRARGSLAVSGEERPVSGIAWIDRQWGRWEDMGIGGWVWFSLQLSNGCEVLATIIYSPVFRRTCTRVVSVKRRDSTELHSTELTIRRLEALTGASGAVYGRRWSVESPGVMSLEVTVDFDGQEFHRGLWEGCCSATGTVEGDEVTGVGYAEQVDRTQGPLMEVLSFAAAPGHFLLQNLLGRANLGLWDLPERLGIWRALWVRR